jgi:hypothetical protein
MYERPEPRDDAEPERYGIACAPAGRTMWDEFGPVRMGGRWDMLPVRDRGAAAGYRVSWMLGSGVRVGISRQLETESKNEQNSRTRL